MQQTANGNGVSGRRPGHFEAIVGHDGLDAIFVGGTVNSKDLFQTLRTTTGFNQFALVGRIQTTNSMWVW